MDLSLSGLASGFDWKSVIDQLTDVERAPQRRLRVEQSKLNQKKDAVAKLITELQALQTKADTLSATDFFTKRAVKSSDETLAKATTSQSTPTGTYKFEFTQLATSSFQQGSATIANTLHTGNVTASSGTGPTMSGARFAAAITPGTFTVNGQQITIESADTLQSVFSKIQTAVPTITASYSSTTDKITLTSSSGNITLGSTADTSNFLQVSRLTANGTSTTATSSATVGRLLLSQALSTQPFRAGNLEASGSFKINGVSISWTDSDTLGTVLQNITDSDAGVDASYDSLSDRIVLTNKSAGKISIAVEDVSGTFMAKAKLTTAAGATLNLGEGSVFKLNGTTYTGKSNVLTELDHGVAGLTVNALKDPPKTVTNQFGTKFTLNTFGNATATTLVMANETHGFATGDRVRFFFTGDVPSSSPQIDVNTDYFVEKLSAPAFSNDEKNRGFRLYTTYADAVAGTNAIDFQTIQAASSLTGDESVAKYSSSSISVPEGGIVSITVSKDTETIKKSITELIDQYNKFQVMVETQTKSSTDADGKVTAGLLSGDRNVQELASALRRKIMDAVTLSDGSTKRIDFLGYKSDGFSNEIKLADSNAFDEALLKSEKTVRELFTISSNAAEFNGIGVRMEAYLKSLVGDDGSLVEHQNTFSKQSTRIDTQIIEMEKQVQSTRKRLMDSFLAMEKAQAKTNQQMQFLLQRFGGGK